MPGARPMAVMATASSSDRRVEHDAAESTADALSYCRDALSRLRGSLFCAVLGDGPSHGTQLSVDGMEHLPDGFRHRLKTPCVSVTSCASLEH